MKENKFKNEMIVHAGGEEILLRPTFSNIAAMENAMGGVAWLAFKFGKGVEVNTKDPNAKPDPEKSAKSLPTMTETAQIIFFNQAEPKFSQEEILELCLAEGIKICFQAVLFLVKVTAGNKLQVEPSDKQKKNSTKKSQVEKA